MSERSDWSVPWPDGSWLTWNEETESWEKQDEPPGGAPKTAEPAPKVEEPPSERTTKPKKAPASKTSSAPVPKASKAASKTQPPKKAPVKKEPAKDAPASAKQTKTVSETPSARAKPVTDAPPARAKAPAAAPQREVPTEQQWSWQPLSDTSEAAPRSRPKPKPSAERPIAHSPRSSVGARPVPQWSVVAAGAAVGVAAGYLLMNLIR